jgi:exodeoxyribonuclease V gamma subunit
VTAQARIDTDSQVVGSDSLSGLVLYRASRLEALLDPLQSLLDATWADNILQPQTVIAAHAGMRQWLNAALAQRVNATGIIANLDIVLSSTWIDRLAHAQLGRKAVSLPRYQRQHLRWAVHAALVDITQVPGLSDPRLIAYLAAKADTDADTNTHLARRRFQLADRLAYLYSQYLVYRPDWLHAWEQGHDDFASKRGSDATLQATERHILAPLWRKLATRLGEHRGDAVTELARVLGKQSGPLPVVHLFGISHLPPSELALTRAYARRSLVALYAPDPCREYWGGISDSRTQLRQYQADEAQRIAVAGENDYWVDQGHPLLARWGRMGQHFFCALADDEVHEDVRHRGDEPTQPENRLQRVQHSIRQLQPALLAVDLSDTTVAAREMTDASLRIHTCHTRLRELEVLRDALLDALTPQPGRAPITPADMVVMAPDIAAYVPLIAAVFGPAGRSQAILPYHLADVAVARNHPLFSAFLALLELPSARISAPAVMDLLAIPEVQRRFAISADDLDHLYEWLRRSRVAWGLDGASRARFGVPAINEHTFSWAMDRMIAGYVMADGSHADDDRGVRLADGCELAPLNGLHGPAAEALGALDRMLQEIQAWCDLGSTCQTASQWAHEMDVRLHAMLRIDANDSAARDAWQILLANVQALANEPQVIDEDPVLHFSVVRDLIAERLQAVPEQQRFLLGGITFCGMVPQRAIPFKLIAVLGLNDGEFPRNSSDGGLDLMARLRRVGDRDVRSDDRYLFLETLMSARERLHLSYLGENVKDGKTLNPAAPLAELLAELDRHAMVIHEAGARPWLVHHPLQPFDARYFDGSDARLFSYNPRFSDMHGAGQATILPPFVDCHDSAVAAMPDSLPLADVLAYYKDPARYLLARKLTLRLDALAETGLREEEPLGDAVERMENVTRRLFFNEALPQWPRADWQPVCAPPWLRLSGLLPPGRGGERAWQHEREAVNMLLHALRRVPGFTGDSAAKALVHDIDVRIARNTQQSCRVVGRITQLFAFHHNDCSGMYLLRAYPPSGSELKRESDLNFRERVSIFLEWALLRLSLARSELPLSALRPVLLVKDEDPPWQRAIQRWDDTLLLADASRQAALLNDLQSRVWQLLHWWHEAQFRVQWYFPATSWQAAQLPTAESESAWSHTLQAHETAALRKVWFDPWRSSGEREYSPGYNRMFAGERRFTNDEPELQALLDFAAALNTCITLPATEAVPL